MFRNNELEHDILDYIRNHQQENINSVDIGCAVLIDSDKHTGMDMEDVMNALSYLENDVIIVRVPDGIRYKYITV